MCVYIYKYIQEKKRREGGVTGFFFFKREKRGAEGPGVVWAAAKKNIKIFLKKKKKKRESHLVGPRICDRLFGSLFSFFGDLIIPIGLIHSFVNAWMKIS